MAAGCGSCTYWSNLIHLTYLDQTNYYIGSDAGRTMTLTWTPASFPELPCPSPLIITWQWFNGTKFTNIPNSAGGDLWIYSGGLNTQNANHSTPYSRVIKFAEPGLYRLRGIMSCGPLFISAEKTQRALHKRIVTVD